MEWIFWCRIQPNIFPLPIQNRIRLKVPVGHFYEEIESGKGSRTVGQYCQARPFRILLIWIQAYHFCGSVKIWEILKLMHPPLKQDVAWILLIESFVSLLQEWIHASQVVGFYPGARNYSLNFSESLSRLCGFIVILPRLLASSREALTRAEKQGQQKEVQSRQWS